MPRVTIDTTEAQSFEATEPGPYPMTIDTVEVARSKEKEGGGGNQSMINVGFQFEDPALAKKCGKVFRNYMLEGKGAGFTREFLKAVTGEDFPIGQTLDFDTDDLLGKHVICQIGNKPNYHDPKKMDNEVERVTAAA